MLQLLVGVMDSKGTCTGEGWILESSLSTDTLRLELSRVFRTVGIIQDLMVCSPSVFQWMNPALTVMYEKARAQTSALSFAVDGLTN